MQFRPLNQVTRQNLVVVLINIGFNIVDLVLVAMAQQGFLALCHYSFVCLLHLHWIKLQHIARLQIDKAVRAVLEVQILFQVAIEDMEQDDLMLIIFKVFQSLEHRLIVIETVKHVGKNHHKTAAVRHFGNLM